MKLYNNDGTKFVHYHGTEGMDCWGQVPLPERWDGSIETLADIARKLHAAISTINRDSIYVGEPPGMPYVADLAHRATFVGEEGVLSTSEPQEVSGEETSRARRVPRRWGER